MYNRLMRKRDEEVIKKVVDKIIDSKVLLTGDGDFFVRTLKDTIMSIEISNLFSAESKIDKVSIRLNTLKVEWSDLDEIYVPTKHYTLHLDYRNNRNSLSFGNVRYEVDDTNDLETSPSFKRLVEYIEENKHLILHNDKEYGKSHTLTDADFI